MDASVASPEHPPASRVEKTVLVLAVVLPIIGTVWGIVLLWNRLVTWTDIWLLVAFYAITGTGIGVGFHRMLTHRSFDAPPWVRFIFLAMGSMALQGPAVEWAATHVKHHAKSDKEGDPHSPLHGFWHSHTGWLFRDDGLVKEGVWLKPFEGDRVAQAIDKTFYVWAILGFVLPGLLGLAIGHSWTAFWTGVLWGGLVRVFLGHHITWSVNSVCHTFGQREFASNDESRNEWIVGLLGFGEGWHNNHHAFPKAAYHGMKWYQFDSNAYIIRGLKRVGLVKNVWMPRAEDMEARRLRNKKQDADAARAPPTASASDVA